MTLRLKGMDNVMAKASLKSVIYVITLVQIPTLNLLQNPLTPY